MQNCHWLVSCMKVLLRDQEIKNMIQQTLNPDENNRSYEPKLTRAKVR